MSSFLPHHSLISQVLSGESSGRLVAPERPPRLRSRTHGRLQMSQFTLLATVILRHKFPIRQSDQSNLGRLLARHCPDEGTFQVVEDAIVVNLLNLFPEPTCVPRVDVKGRWVQILPRKVLARLVQATRAEVFRVVTGFCEEIASNSLRFEAEFRILYVKGREVASWRDQDEGNRPQIDLLSAFQTAKWASSIPNPLPLHFELGGVLKNLNKKVKQSVNFTQRNGHVLWDWA